MKNLAVLNRFLTYIAITVGAGAVFFGITFGSKELFGHGGYGLIGMLTLFTLWFLYVSAKSNVEWEEKEARWAQEKIKNKLG